MRCFFSVFLSVLFIMPVVADVLSLENALQNTYIACVGIDDGLYDLKKMAGINTAITGIGTGLGAGATTVGIVKANKDNEAEELEKLIKELHELEDNEDEPTEAEIQVFLQEFNDSYDLAIQDLTTALDNLNKKSKTLGNWRTGLLAGNTATNIAGAIISKNNKVDDDLQTQIDNCKLAVKELRNSISLAKFNGEDVTEATEIVNACGEYDYVDISKINNRATGAMISSIVGTATGVTGTVTSVVANTDKTRNDNSDEGKQKEKNLNTTSNVLAGASTVASGVATAFNATQISAIKKVANVAEKCTGVLK